MSILETQIKAYRLMDKNATIGAERFGAQLVARLEELEHPSRVSTPCHLEDVFALAIVAGHYALLALHVREHLEATQTALLWHARIDRRGGESAH